jgi:uncharacterized membrane-anchored protein
MKTLSLLLALLLAPLAVYAQTATSESPPAGEPSDEEARSAAAIAQFEGSLNFESGRITLPGGFANLDLSPNFRFLGAAHAKRVLVDAWGNPPDATAEVLGMVFPAQGSPLAKDAWAVVITYEKDGYVKDEEADGIDYNALLKQMQEHTADANEQRRKAGYGSVELVGWAQPPFYDKATHKLHWAKHLKFDDAPGGTLNYDIRVLGRYGVLSMNAVAGIDQLGAVKQGMQEVLGFTEFNAGHRYADFDSSRDKVAAYGLAALVAGGVAAKMGLFAKLGALLLSLKKVLLFLVAGAAALLGKLFKGRGKQEA